MEILARENLTNLANLELFTKNFFANIHGYTKNVFDICTDQLYFSLLMAFTCMVGQKPLPKFSRVVHYSIKLLIITALIDINTVLPIL